MTIKELVDALDELVKGGCIAEDSQDGHGYCWFCGTDDGCGHLKACQYVKARKLLGQDVREKRRGEVQDVRSMNVQTQTCTHPERTFCRFCPRYGDDCDGKEGTE